MSCKWLFEKQINLSSTSNAGLREIVQFYVWETPVGGTSQKAVTFERLGITGARYKTLQAGMRKSSGFPAVDGHDWIAATSNSIGGELEKLDRLESYDCSFEFAIHTVKDGFGKTQALFYFIRNALAHGGFDIVKFKREKYYALENRRGTDLKGRAILKESTLLDWARLLKKLRP